MEDALKLLATLVAAVAVPFFVIFFRKRISGGSGKGAVRDVGAGGEEKRRTAAPTTTTPADHHPGCDVAGLAIIPGAHVSVCGLKRRPELNGSPAIVSSYIPQTRRWKVRLSKEGGAAGYRAATIWGGPRLSVNGKNLNVSSADEPLATGGGNRDLTDYRCVRLDNSSDGLDAHNSVAKGNSVAFNDTITSPSAPAPLDWTLTGHAIVGNFQLSPPSLVPKNARRVALHGLDRFCAVVSTPCPHLQALRIEGIHGSGLRVVAADASVGRGGMPGAAPLFAKLRIVRLGEVELGHAKKLLANAPNLEYVALRVAVSPVAGKTSDSQQGYNMEGAGGGDQASDDNKCLCIDQPRIKVLHLEGLEGAECPGSWRVSEAACASLVEVGVRVRDVLFGDRAILGEPRKRSDGQGSTADRPVKSTVRFASAMERLRYLHIDMPSRAKTSSLDEVYAPRLRGLIVRGATNSLCVGVLLSAFRFKRLRYIHVSSARGERGVLGLGKMDVLRSIGQDRAVPLAAPVDTGTDFLEVWEMPDDAPVLEWEAADVMCIGRHRGVDRGWGLGE